MAVVVPILGAFAGSIWGYFYLYPALFDVDNASNTDPQNTE